MRGTVQHWLAHMKPNFTCHILRAIARSIGADLKIDHLGLLSEEPSVPDTQLPSDEFRHQWFVYNLLRKREVDRECTTEAALAAFRQSEAQCLTIEKTGSITANLDWLSKWSLLGARNIAHEILGSVPSNWYQECTFTGGASTSRRRSDSHPALKWWASPSLHVTPLAYRHLEALRKSSPVIDTAWSDPGILSMSSCTREVSYFKIVPGSRLELVEKNYKTKRAILIEPDGNMLLQKGVGNIIRRRLKTVGINLNDQTRNQRLAFAGSLSGSLGTIDLSAASDSVSLSLLRLLLPEDWYQLIYELRSPCYYHDGSWHTMRKVSSMGNGFTFELESLVFYCLTKAVVNLLRPADTRIGIYGDDIIVASSVCGALESVLNRCGFSLNKEKSYWHGPFRESCGKHYHNGADVTPVYAKKDLSCLSQCYRLYNQIRDWAGGDFVDSRYTELLEVVLSSIPVRDRTQVPREFSPTSGLWFRDVAHRKVRYYMTSDGVPTLSFSVFRQERFDLTDRCDPELAWLYRLCERWVPSDPLGLSDYTPFALVREGKLVRQRVSIPACRVTGPIP